MSAVTESPPWSISTDDAVSSGRPADGQFGHGKAIGSIGDRPSAHLLPRNRGHHEQHFVELEGMANVDCGHEMADVRWVEGPAEDADASRVDHGESLGVSPGHRG